MVFLKNLKSLVLIKEKKSKKQNSGSYRNWQELRVPFFLKIFWNF